jgi:hypothetical protein
VDVGVHTEEPTALSERSFHLDCGRAPPPLGLKAGRFSYTMLS